MHPSQHDLPLPVAISRLVARVSQARAQQGTRGRVRQARYRGKAAVRLWAEPRGEHWKLEPTGVEGTATIPARSGPLQPEVGQAQCIIRLQLLGCPLEAATAALDHVDAPSE